jgi:hypothetical protein
VVAEDEHAEAGFVALRIVGETIRQVYNGDISRVLEK